MHRALIVGEESRAKTYAEDLIFRLDNRTPEIVVIDPPSWLLAWVLSVTYALDHVLPTNFSKIPVKIALWKMKRVMKRAPSESVLFFGDMIKKWYHTFSILLMFVGEHLDRKDIYAVASINEDDFEKYLIRVNALTIPTTTTPSCLSALFQVDQSY